MDQLQARLPTLFSPEDWLLAEKQQFVSEIAADLDLIYGLNRCKSAPVPALSFPIAVDVPLLQLSDKPVDPELRHSVMADTPYVLHLAVSPEICNVQALPVVLIPSTIMIISTISTAAPTPGKDKQTLDDDLPVILSFLERTSSSEQRFYLPADCGQPDHQQGLQCS